MITVNGYIYEYKLETPLSISFYTWYYRENVIVELKYKNFTGLGEATPFKGITGDDQKDVIRELKRLKQLDIDPVNSTLSNFHALLENLGIQSTTLKAALDFAFHDLKGKILGIPSYKLYIDKYNKVQNSVTIFLKDSDDSTIQEANRIRLKHPHLRAVKIKLKGDSDIKRCCAVKKCFDNNITYVLDANQGFSKPDKAVNTLNDICSILGKVLLIEEPCDKGDLDKLKYVKDHINNTLIFADESAVNIDDVKRIIKYKAAHGINIKLQKTAGIWPAKQIADLCIASDLKIMVGSMLDCYIASAASIHFAVSTDSVILSDIDMDLDLQDHIVEKLEFEDGIRVPNSNNGLGVEFDSFKLNNLIKNGTVKYSAV
ncbi:MAG: hypothetical protein GY756_05125 [bacterium]|nr:hypothetical protein [bacterium]